jgi:hypothetical protein
MSFEKRIHNRNIFHKEIEMKWSTLRNIGIFFNVSLTRSELRKSSDVGYCNQNTTILWYEMVYKLIEFIKKIDLLIKIAGNVQQYDYFGKFYQFWSGSILLSRVWCKSKNTSDISEIWQFRFNFFLKYISLINILPLWHVLWIYYA